MAVSLSPMDTLRFSRPVGTTTPFTQRDNDTFLTILKGLQDTLNDLIEQVNANDVASQNDLNTAIADLTNKLNLALMDYEAYLTALVQSSHDEGIVFDPTNGTHIEGFSLVLGRVYDNARVFAYFAKQYDNLNLTAAAYDALAYSARHFDLGVTYPTLNDTQA
jgi:hypothetical protein